MAYCCAKKTVFAVLSVITICISSTIYIKLLQIQTLPYRRCHKLCVLVPFRNRHEQLVEFAPHMHTFLENQNISHSIVVLNQNDSYRFNRATLINVGFLETKNECDYIAIHDVDLLPLNPNVSYAYPEGGLFHVSASGLHPTYRYKTFAGGIMLVNKYDFQKLNGMATSYWGWGKEDDEFYQRILFHQLTINQPQNITTGKKTFNHLHTDNLERDKNRTKVQKDAHKYELTHHVTGLDTTKYFLKSTTKIDVNGIPCKTLNIELKCDDKKTPWCKPSKPSKSTNQANQANLANQANQARTSKLEKKPVQL